MKPFFVYLLRCADGTYYTGHTDDLERRIAEHASGLIPGYTHERRPLELVWSQETATREEALSAELRIKGWSRAKKEALVVGDWKRVSMLAMSGGLRRAQPERDSGVRRAQPEQDAGFGRGKAERDAGLRQAQPERITGRLLDIEPHPARGECIEGSSKSAVSDPTRPEPVEGSSSNATPNPARPEPVEGPSSDANAAWIASLLRSDRRSLAKAITLIESTRPDHRARADHLLNALLPHTGHAMRLGISGTPGVGKSTFIEALGLALIDKGHRVAVLAIDPSSSINGGSILGDKTRMEKLSVNEAAYIRPSPASGTLGGVAEKTREAMLVCEAAGYDVVIVETVGVGQSETAVASMTDMFVLMQLPNAGDDLQALKKGVMELADLIVVNKADLDPDAAARAEAHIESSLRLFAGHVDPTQWVTKVMQLSALKSQGIDAFRAAVEEFHAKRRASGEFEARRRRQALAWMWDIVEARLHADFRHHPAVRAALPTTLDDVAQARVAPSAAARALLNLFGREPR